MNLQLNNGTILEVLCVNGSTRFFQGTSRDTLEIQVAKETVPFDQLDTLFADSGNTKRLKLIDGENEFIHDNYSLRVEMALKSVIVTPATSTSQEISEERITVTLAQKSYLEMQQEQLQETVDRLVLSSLKA